ncbi:MCE family protein [Mycobacterium nebraskense]|uniref:MCE-family protein MCE1A n=1 Tax=Mycobacterium nebraskense TaxID=244292 RepID=A0A0F5N5I6_9MYCO|nr:MCE family protein [Mycobacterium nebraskense]KKC02150.1 MCE-family protein MCE1A [Mycobacterium nebraskense]KLO46298.1 MCE-family protein MCE1A [Mycobacterium nebraskense]MBI2696540.1 MCE family protein [Mycobacterium nebraskense]MCV7117291.1 MCE family protein [Mycobacterium nebraskense]ORW23363.1 MCE-family protein MCE1A [Mycobacterium nebraskense]
MERRRSRRGPRYKSVGLVTVVIMGLVGSLLYLQFRGDLTPKTKLTLVAARAGLVLDPGSKVTYNGVQIGRVASISEITRDGKPAAKVVLDITPRYVKMMPANVVAAIKATTVFGNKYVALNSPPQPAAQPITPSTVIDATAVTTEFNTVFETLMSIAEKVDPVKVNLTLSAAAQALTGLGEKFGASLVNGNTILDDVNPQMGDLRADIARLAALGDTYANASPDLWAALDHAVTASRTLNRRQVDLDAALLAAAGLGGTGADVFGRGGPYLARGAADLVGSSQLLDEYSPEIFCTIRNFNEVGPRIHNALGDNGYSLGAHAAGAIAGAPNPYIWPENLPRTNARGGPGGRPGCWQTITRQLWPAPFLVMDTGASMAPYNHFEIGSPLFVEHVWGRQVGDYTINP